MRKKQNIQLIVRSAVAVVLAVLLALMPVLFPAETMELVELHTIDVFAVEESSVQKLSWTYEGKHFQIVKNGQNWYYADEPELELNLYSVEAMLDKICEVKAGSVIEQPEALSVYGLDQPTAQVTVTTATTEQTFLIGATTGLGSDRFFSKGDGKVYQVGSSIITPFLYSIEGIVKKEAVPSVGTAQIITVTNANGSVPIQLQEKTDGTSAWFSGEQELNPTAVSKLLSPAVQMQWRECVAYRAEDFAQYGLDAPVATLAVTEGETTKTVEFGAPAGERKIYARISGSSYVYTVDTTVSDPLVEMTLISLLP